MFIAVCGGIFCAVRGKIFGAVSGEIFVVFMVYGNEKYAIDIRGTGTYGTTGERKKSRSCLYLGDNKREK